MVKKWFGPRNPSYGGNQCGCCGCWFTEPYNGFYQAFTPPIALRMIIETYPVDPTPEFFGVTYDYSVMDGTYFRTLNCSNYGCVLSSPITEPATYSWSLPSTVPSWPSSLSINCFIAANAGVLPGGLLQHLLIEIASASMLLHPAEEPQNWLEFSPPPFNIVTWKGVGIRETNHFRLAYDLSENYWGDMYLDIVEL